MKKATFFILSFITFSLNAQIEITNLDTVVINEIDSPQFINLVLENMTNESIDLDWEIEFANNIESFMQISVSDINNHYTPLIHSSCNLSQVTNILLPSETYQMGLDFIFDEVPSTVDKNSPIAYFNLYEADNCSGEKLSSIPILINGTTTNTLEVSKDKRIKIYPNPSDGLLTINYENNSSQLSFEIFNIQLKKIMNGVIENDKIDISNLLPGQYILRVDNHKLLFLKN